MKENISKRKGFTLIEILVAMMIFFLAMFGGIKLIKAAAENNANSRNTSTAVFWTSNVVEWLRCQPVYLSDGTRNTTYYGDSLPFSATPIQNYPYGPINGISYTLTWTATEITGSDCIKVDVYMTWTEKSIPRSYQVTFVKGRYSG